MKRQPTHPGTVLREDVLPAMEGMSVAGLARELRISRQTVHGILNETVWASSWATVPVSGCACRTLTTSGKLNGKSPTISRPSSITTQPDDRFNNVVCP